MEFTGPGNKPDQIHYEVLVPLLMAASTTIWRSLALIITLAAVGDARLQGARYQLDEFKGVPDVWRRAYVPPPSSTLELIIAVRQQNLDALEPKLMQVSTPDDESYGKHLSLDAVNELVKPASESVLAVQSWLAEHGFDAERDVEYSPAKDFLLLRTTVDRAEQMLQTKVL